MSVMLSRTFSRLRTVDGSHIALDFARQIQLRRFLSQVQPDKTRTASSSGRQFSGLRAFTSDVVEYSRSVGVPKDDLFSYKAQRWLWNEDLQLQSRFVQFDLDALVKVAEEAAGTGMVAMNVSRLSEGNFNKVFLVTMLNGSEVVVKIPNPNAGRSHYTTASEAATMRYVKDKLQIPAPKLLAYCSRAEKSKLGTEYIVMEKASGVELSRVWDTMKAKNKMHLVQQIATITSRLGNARFKHYGSLYYRCDVDHVRGTEVDDEYVIGPNNDRGWFDNRRGEIDINRGPWSSSLEVMSEMTCLRTLQPLFLDRCHGIFNGPLGYHPTRDAKMSVLQDYLQVVPYILPKEEALNSGTMWHYDLHPANIFVDEADNSKITNIIDWQAIPVFPTFAHVDHPALIRYEGEKPTTFEPPTLPTNIEELGPQEKKRVEVRFVEESLWTSYEIQLQQACPALIYSFRHGETLLGQILRFIGLTFDDGEPLIRRLLTELSQSENWKVVVGEDSNGNPKIACPLRYSEEEIRAQKFEHDIWAIDIMRKVQVIEELGAYIGWDGAVPLEQYDDIVVRLENAKQRFLDREADTPEKRDLWEKAWPFRDGATMHL